MLAIRLARVGAKKQAAFRVVVMEKSRARNSRSVEIVGHYNPRSNPTAIDLKQERVDYWLSKGAQPSDRVSRLLKVYKERPDDFAEVQAAKAAEEKQAAREAAAKAAAESRAAEQQVAEAKAAEAKAAEAKAAEAKAAEAEATPAADASGAASAEAAPAAEPASGDEAKSTS